MLFNSLQFLMFFPIVVVLYFILPTKYRWLLLLVSSYLFYMAWKPIYAVLIVISTLVDYYASIRMEKYDSEYKRKIFLALSLITNLGILFIFKYFNMFAETLNSLRGGTLNTLSLLLPMGISFYTFQTLSYTIDVYNKKRKAEKHFGYFALYVTYFPQLVAGPIERSDRLLPQLKKEHKFDSSRVADGLRRMLWGFFKKMVIADNLAAIVNNAYGNIEDYDGFSLLIATCFFAIQIYCDFSGYSDIAIGASSIMGIKLMENFKRPYLSTSIKEFWSRWHISLSTWFRDYVYIPLGGSRGSKSRTFLNILIVFLVSGLWHGANWTFVAWGGIHALYQIYETLTYNVRIRLWKHIRLDQSKIQKSFQWLITISVVLFAWIFFRAESLEQAWNICKKISYSFVHFNNLNHTLNTVKLSFPNKSNIIIAIVSILLLLIDHILLEFKGINIFQFVEKNQYSKWIYYYLLIIWIILMANYGVQEFIYFQF